MWWDERTLGRQSHPDEMMRMDHRDFGDDDINDPWWLHDGAGWEFLS